MVEFPGCPFWISATNVNRRGPIFSLAAERGTPARFGFPDWVNASLPFRITNVVLPCKRARVPRSAAPN